MSNVAIDKKDDACPPVSVWSNGTIATAPSTGTELADVDFIEMGLADVTAADANSDAIGVALQYAAGFDDSVFFDAAFGTKPRVWMSNKPTNTLYKIFCEFDSTATLPAVSLNAVLTSGTEIPGDPDLALAGDALIYDSAAKRLAWLLLQVQATKIGALDYDQSDQIHGAPVVHWATPRMDPNVTRLSPSDYSMDTEAGHMFTYTDVLLFIKNANGDFEMIGGGQNVNSIKEDTIEIETTEEHIEWAKGKPTTTYQVARTSLVGSINFKLDQCVPAVEALAHQVDAEDDLTLGNVKYSVNAKSARVKENEYLIMFRSLGGFVCSVRVSRGILTKSGAMTPGATEFAGNTYNVKALASGPKHETAEITYSSVATELSSMPASFQIEQA